MQKRILAVDDEEDIRILLKAVLEDEGYEVVLAEDGTDAIEILKNQKFDLILIDYFMPKMSGKELVLEIRKNSKFNNTKLILLTVAEFGESVEYELKNLGVLEYMKKPIENKDMVKIIHNVIPN